MGRMADQKMGAKTTQWKSFYKMTPVVYSPKGKWTSYEFSSHLNFYKLPRCHWKCLEIILSDIMIMF